MNADAPTWAKAIEAFTAYVKIERGFAPGTVSSYARILGRLAAWVEGRGLAGPGDVGRKNIAAYLAHRASERSAASAAAALYTFRTFFDFLHVERMISTKAAADLEAPRVPQRVARALSRGDVDLLLAAPDTSTPRGLRDSAILETLYGSGLRVGGVVGLRLEDLHLADGYLVTFEKGSKERIAPVGARERARLEEYLARGRPELLRGGETSAVFLASHGGPLTRQRIGYIVRILALRAGLRSRVTPHVLRHTFASHLLEGGANVRLVQEMLGHADVATTQRYTHVRPAHLREVWRACHPRARGEGCGR